MEMYPSMELVQGVPEDLGLQYFGKEQRNLLIIDDCQHLTKKHEGHSELIRCGVHHCYIAEGLKSPRLKVVRDSERRQNSGLTLGQFATVYIII